MRRGILVLIALSLSWPLYTPAKEVLVGTVVSVDPEKGTLVFRPMGGGPADADMTLEMPPKGLPPFVKPGAVLRIWGTHPQGTPHRFVPRRITRGDPRRPPADPTGVRKRLMRGRSMPPPRRPPPGGKR